MMLGYLFQSSFFQYAPMIVAGLVALLFIPGLMVTGAKPEGVGRAIVCVLWKAFGLVLIALSVTQLASDVVLSERLTEQPMLSVLVLIMVVGIGIMVQASRVLAGVDAASKAVPRLVFILTCETIGGLLVVVSMMTILVNFLMTNALTGWEMQTVLGLLGVVLMLGASLHVSPKAKVVRKKK
ncbi:MAG: hypothetical protein ABL890_04190 [Candidatus Peribacteraceae bacterium]